MSHLFVSNGKRRVRPARVNTIGGQAVFELGHAVTSTENFVKISGVVSGSPALIESLGSDSNIGLDLVPTGDC